jgi:tetratricopeptide (TPR) repeat protein
LKSSHRPAKRHGLILATACALLLGGIAIVARGEIPEWLQNIEAGTPVENALFRLMTLPGGDVLARRPLQEARPLLDKLVESQPKNADLYSLRAMEEEQQLDFDASEKDWKAYAHSAADRTTAQIALADFYHRRARPKDEIAALSLVTQSSSSPSENLLAPQQQQSWLAFTRIFAVISSNAIPAESSSAQYRAWIARYPREASLYARYFEFLLAQKQYDRAADLISAYQKSFSQDAVFPVKAQALLNFRKGNLEQALAVYDGSFQPLWPQTLIQGYFNLLGETHTLRKFLDASRAAHAANPGDLNALARLFYYYQQEGKPDVAQQLIEDFRAYKESTKTPWAGEELYTLARLLEKIQAYPEAARYYYALYNAGAAPENRERALNGLINLLLASPEQPIRLGAGDLSMYKDIGTADPGPGFLNGILSLLFNDEDPKASLADEEQRGVPYFHRAEAAKLLALLDGQFPKAPERSGLHARLLQAYVEYGESDTVIARGREFLTAFPDSPLRTRVSLLMADAYARLGKTDDEFAIYDAVLRELAKKSQGVPLGPAASPLAQWQWQRGSPMSAESADQSDGQADGHMDDQDSSANQETEDSPRTSASAREALSLAPVETPQPSGPRSASYSGVLERYLSRLAALKQLPQALQILRREVDRNPNDPGLYERLAQFLDQNQLGAQEEEVYKRAIQQFPDRSWYHKLARLYLRHKRNGEFESLSNQVVKIFAGSELESYFGDVVARSGNFGPQLYLRLNLGASQRFPHNQAFVRNLLSAYRTPGTADEAAWEKVLRQHWFEDDALRAEFFEFLSRTHKLDGELAALRAANPEAAGGQWAQAAQSNPAAVQFFAEAELWQSHFENAMLALGALAAEFPADVDLGRRSSTVYRSLAYIDPQNTESAVRVEQNLLKSDPANRDTLARIGDIYADRDMFAEAAPYWNRMAQIEPGNSNSYLEAATVFWDYYKFDDALRLLNSGRAKLSDPSLFAYEEGAIFENEREYPRAIEEYVKGALAGGDSMEAGNRLLSLARRPKLRAAVDRGTAHIADAQNPAIGSIRLRVQVLKAQDRTGDVQSFLLALIDRSDSIELVEQLEALAQQESLEDVLQRAIEQEVKLTTDPVRRLEMRYALVQFFESKKDFVAAQRNIDALYQENPKILGVVHATVDFYWRRKMQQHAIDILLQAAKDSYPALHDKFDYEAARKATDAGNFDLARQLLDPLLQQSPYDGELLAAMADTYARAGDSAGLRDFYIAKIALFRQAPFAPDERTRRIAELRRGLIPALTQLKDYVGADDQYIEIIKQFPEDAGLTAEVALYAEQHALQSRVTAFYAKTVSDSPQDYRWAMVLARLQTHFEDYPAAIDSYTKSIGVRPDRTDLYIARADLLERLMRFDEAAADYAKLYTLAYHDPKWTMKLAEVRARQGKADETVAALKAAWVEGQSANPQKFFAAAQSLESWGMLPQAKDLAQQGVDAAGGDLLANPENHAGAKIYVRVLTRLRLQQEAYAALDAALQAARTPATSLSTAVKQFEKQGLAAVTDSEWRDRGQKARANAGIEGMDACMKEIGATVALYFTPQEKTVFSQFLAGKQNGTAQDFLILAAEAAGLAPLEARWRYEALLADPLRPSGHLQRLIELQSHRLKFAELANQLEIYAAKLPWTSQPYVLMAAADAYQSAGFDSTELRIYSELDARGHLYQKQQRYFELLFALQPQKLVELAGNSHSRWYEAATDFAIASGDNKLAYDAVRAHGASLTPVWTKAYTGLAGLYFGDPALPVNASFHDILNDRPIGDRLGKSLDLDQQLAGNTWFYYGSRYGEYLGTTHQGNSEDYIPAVLEQSPGSADAYLITAEYYADATDYPRAIADYQHSLELSPSQAGVRDRLALIYWKSGQHPQAIAEWKKALGILKAAQDPNLSNNFVVIARHLGERKLAAEFRPEMDALLRDYIRRTGSYNAAPLLRAAYTLLGDPAAATSWILDLASAAADPTSVLAELVDANWIPLLQHEPIYRRILEIQQAEVDKREPGEKEGAQLIQRQWQVRWFQYLLETRQFERAKTELSSLLEDTQNPFRGNFTPIELRIAAAQNMLDPILSGYRADPDHAPGLEVLRGAAAAIETAGQKPAAQKILEFAYSREIERHNLNAANFLGLAEIRLDAGDTRGALDQLNRLVLVVGEPFENLEAAAALLEKSGHPADAAVFLLQFARVTPWQPEVHLRLARARIAAASDAASENSSNARNDLAAIAAASDVPYDLRARAASALAGSGSSPDLGSDELNLLAAGNPISPTLANQPFSTRSRLVAASQLPDDQQRIDLLRAILDDSPSSDAARVQLLFAAASSHEYQLAFSAIQPLLNSPLFAPAQPNTQQANTGQAEQVNPEQVDNDQEPPQENAAPAQVESQTPDIDSSQSAASNAERLRIATEVAAVMENLGRLDDAARYLASAEKLERSEPRQKEFHKRLVQARTELARRAANSLRAPQIHKELEQSRLVRPRLLAQAARQEKSSAPAEGSNP